MYSTEIFLNTATFRNVNLTEIDSNSTAKRHYSDKLRTTKQTGLTLTTSNYVLGNLFVYGNRECPRTNILSYFRAKWRILFLLLFFFFVIYLFLLDRRRYNIKEVNLLITVYSLTTAYNLTKSKKKKKKKKKRSYNLRNTTRDELHKTRKQYLHNYLEVLIIYLQDLSLCRIFQWNRRQIFPFTRDMYTIPPIVRAKATIALSWTSC